jgi:hypothetical protein
MQTTGSCSAAAARCRHTVADCASNMNTSSQGPLVAKGRTAEVFAWEADKVLKLFYEWCSPDMVRQETAIARAVSAMPLPVPRLIDTVEIGARLGIIYERVDGPSMLAVCSSKPWLVFRMARLLAELHTELHRMAGEGFPSLRPSLRAAIESAPSLPPDLKAGALQLFEALPDGRALCHLDFHPDQVLLTAQGPVIIDWMTARQGHPLADVARTAIMLSIGQVPYGSRAMRVIVNLWRGLFLRAYLARYIELNPGVSREAIRTWMAPLSAARLHEKIDGERPRLLAIIRARLPSAARREA